MFSGVDILGRASCARCGHGPSGGVGRAPMHAGRTCDFRLRSCSSLSLRGFWALASFFSSLATCSLACVCAAFRALNTPCTGSGPHSYDSQSPPIALARSQPAPSRPHCAPLRESIDAAFTQRTFATPCRRTWQSRHCLATALAVVGTARKYTSCSHCMAAPTQAAQHRNHTHTYGCTRLYTMDREGTGRGRGTCLQGHRAWSPRPARDVSLFLRV